MNYNKIYNKLIEVAHNRTIDGYSEIHHIIPKCMGGTDISNNLVQLTAREHFIAHLLLARIYGGKMWHAAHMMSNMKRYSSRIYKKVREEHAKVSRELQVGKIISPEIRKNMSLAHQGQISWAKGQSFTDEHRQNLSKALTRRKLPDEVRKKMGESRKGHAVADSTRAKISESNKGCVSSMAGKHHRDDSKIKSSVSNRQAHLGKKRKYNHDGTWYWLFPEKT